MRIATYIFDTILSFCFCFDNVSPDGRDVQAATSAHCILSGKIELYVDTIQRIYLSSGNIYSDNTLVLGLVRVEYSKVSD
jgi:hypothetical protein